MTDDDREILIRHHIRMVIAYAGVPVLVHYYLDRARELIKGRSQEQIRKMEKAKGLS